MDLQEPKKPFLKKYWWLLLIGVIFILVLILLISAKPILRLFSNGSAPSANSTDAIAKGKNLSGNNCTGKGSKPLGSPPMNPSDIGYIVPYGLLAGGHVTPIDHEYYWGKIPMGEPDSYPVLALADGTIVDVQYRPHQQGQFGNSNKVKGDYRVVIMYSCTFFSYFDLATSLAPNIESKLPQGWEQNKMSSSANIPIKEGEVIAKMGGQSLDFAVWDTTKTLKNLLVPIAYNNAEPWKINTVPPLNYFTSKVKDEILPFYARKIQPLDGVIDQDIDGKASGSWFKQGTNGYAGIFSQNEKPTGSGYFSGHLALVHDLYDSTGWLLSVGNVNGQPAQFALKNPSPTPDLLDTNSGIVKYDLGQWQDVDDTGNMWTGQAVPQGNLKMVAGNSLGVALVQLQSKRILKIEVFLNKTPDQVTDFDANALTYDRGDNAKLLP